jgi:hypothetical protein
LQGANLKQAQLQGADLSGAQLQGADLSGAEFRGANLEGAVLYASKLYAVLFQSVNARSLKWQPLSTEEIQSLRETQTRTTWSSKAEQSRYSAAIDQAAAPGLQPPLIGSCMRNEQTQVTCASEVGVEQFHAARLAELERVACGSADAAHVMVSRIESIEGLASRLQNRIKTAESTSCWGLAKLSAADKARLSRAASK